MEVLFFLLWIVFCAVAADIASKKGLRSADYFIISFFLSPLIGILVAIVARPNASNIEEEQIRSGLSKRCPSCAEVVKRHAVVCRFCGNDFTEAQLVPEAVQPDPEFCASETSTPGGDLFKDDKVPQTPPNIRGRAWIWDDNTARLEPVESGRENYGKNAQN